MSNHATQPPAASGSSPRLFVLLGILIVAIGALAYDYKIARPGAENGYAEVMKLAELRSQSKHGDDAIGPSQVQAKLGKQPAHVEKTDRYMIETYNWRSGALVKAYFVKVVYIGSTNPVLYTALINEEPKDENLPSNRIPTADDADPRPKDGPVGMSSGGNASSRPATGASTTLPVAPTPATDSEGDVTKPKDTAPPANDKPTTDAPSTDKPAGDKPAGDKPATDKPAEDKPADKKSGSTSDAGTQNPKESKEKPPQDN